MPKSASGGGRRIASLTLSVNFVGERSATLLVVGDDDCGDLHLLPLRTEGEVATGEAKVASVMADAVVDAVADRLLQVVDLLDIAGRDRGTAARSSESSLVRVYDCVNATKQGYHVEGLRPDDLVLVLHDSDSAWRGSGLRLVRVPAEERGALAMAIAPDRP